MRVLVGCEFSGRVRQAFRDRGHDAWSCDLEPAEDESEFHFQQDVRTAIGDWHWDLMIAHPPCRDLAVSGARWFREKRQDQAEAIEFVIHLMEADIERIAIENPVSVLSSRWRRPDQIIDPWMFGHGETKSTCLWLKNLPRLMPTHTLVAGREARVHREPPSVDRWKNRSRTYSGIAEAMAEQWGDLGTGYATWDAKESTTVARPDHFGDCAATFNKVNRQLWAELQFKVPYEAIAEIRRIRSKRSGRQGNSEVKMETKILLAIREGIPWQHASSREIEYITPRWRGGADALENMKLSEHVR